MKNTKQKQAIFSAVQDMKCHPTAEAIYTKLKCDNPKISLGTVYRNLRIYSGKGEITRVSVPNESDRFDYRLDEHEHFFCRKCGNVFDADIEVSINPKNSDLQIESFALMLYGVCNKCMKKQYFAG